MADLSEQEQPPQEMVVPQRPPGFERRARRCLGRPFWLRDFDIPAMRDAPRTRRSNRRRFHLPFRFSEWIRSDAVSMNPPDEFVDVYWEPRCRNSKFKFIETGEIFHITADVDERGRCVFAGGFPDFVYGIGFEGEVRLDFSYIGKGVFEVRIGGDSEEVLVRIGFCTGDGLGGVFREVIVEDDGVGDGVYVVGLGVVVRA